MLRVRFSALLIGMALTSLPGVARGFLLLDQAGSNVEVAIPEESASEETIDAAEELFSQGIDLMRDQRWVEALDKLEQSFAKHPTSAARLNTAICYERLRQYTAALAHYEDPIFASAEPRLRQEADRAKARVSRRVAEIQVTSPVVGAHVFIDELERGITPFQQAVRVDPGTHIVRVSKKGYADAKIEISLAGGDRQVVHAPLAVVEPTPLSANREAPTRRSSARALPRPTLHRPFTLSRPDQSPRVVRRGDFAEWSVAFLISPSLGGDASSGCTECRRQLAWGGASTMRWGLVVTPRLSCEAALGYLEVKQSVRRSLALMGERPEFVFSSDDVHDSVRLSAPLVAIGASYRPSTRLPILLRLSTGMAFGYVRSSISGHFTGSAPRVNRADMVEGYVGALKLREDPRWTLIPFTAPEVRIEHRLSESLTFQASFAIWLMYAPSYPRRGGAYPRREPRRPTLEDVVGPDGEAEIRPGSVMLPRESALGFAVMLAPGIAVHWKL